MHFRPLRKLAFAASVTLAFAYVGCGSDSGGGGGSGGGAAASGTGGAGSGGGGTSGSGASGGGGSGGLNIGGGGSGGSGGGGGSAGDACASTEVVGTLKTANLLFVIDRSGSMNCNLPPTQTTAECEAFPAPKVPADPTKWDLTELALAQATDDLATSGNVNAGLVVFPRPASECQVTQTPDVEIKPLDTTQATDIKTFLATVDPKGKTPLAGATILSYAYLYELLKANAVDGNLFVVLLTDGFETCATEVLPQLLAQDVPNALSINVRTFVIGVPGSEDGRALLSQIAWNGGTPKTSSCTHNPAPNDVGDCHFDMTTSANFGQDLKNALTQISGTVLSCELDVPTPEPGKEINYNDVKVYLNGGEVTKDESKPCDQGANGWQFNQDKSKIFLCGTTCDDAKQQGASLKINLGCLIDVR